MTIAIRQLIEHIEHPFGKGNLATDGVQWSTEVTGIDENYAAIETVTITLPGGVTIVEVEFGLTAQNKSSSTAKDVLSKFQASNDNSAWEDICAEQTHAANASAYAEETLSGRFAPIGNFDGKTSTFYVRYIIKAETASSETVTGQVKNSSYVKVLYKQYAG